MAQRFWRKFAEGDVHFRDDYQFELKSEFVPSSTEPVTTYMQEFYLFVPHALNVNTSNYGRNEFYHDQTTLIRYKTPEMTFKELLDPENHDSPITRLKERLVRVDRRASELKLLGNMVRSHLRDRVRGLVTELEAGEHQIGEHCLELVQDLKQIRSEYEHFDKDYLPDVAYRYVGEFIDVSIQLYLTGLLEEMRSIKEADFGSADYALCSLIKETAPLQFPEEGTEEDQEFVLYRKGLLNKFVLDALLLSTERLNQKERYTDITGMFAAGLAMFIYLLLFIWQGQHFVLNSLPFVIITCFLYILKDRTKEWTKRFYSNRAPHWFPDYVTKVRSPSQERVVGTLTESFSYVKPAKVPEEIFKVRNEGFHAELEAFKRPESVIRFTRKISLRKDPLVYSQRRHGLTVLFRFSISRFLHKASNAWQSFPFLTDNDSVTRISLPKVYHLNIIACSRYVDDQGAPVKEINKFRCIIDKRGIKRVDRVS